MAWAAAIPAIVAAGGIAAQAAGSAMGDRRAKADQQQQEWYIDRAISEYENLGQQLPQYESALPVAPDLQEMGPQEFGRYTLQGQLSPEQEYAISQGDSEMNKVYTDPRLRDAQLSALSSLEEVGNGGMTMADKAALAQIQENASMQERGSREAILQNAKQRGMGGSGMEMLAQLSSGQNSANRARMEGLNVAATAQQRALDAMTQAGTLGGNIRGQDFSEGSAKATSQDAINRFNTANSQTVQGRNVDRGNTAQEKNLAARQGLANSNVDVGNDQTKYNVGLSQYNNDVRQKTYGNTMGQIDYRNQLQDKQFGNRSEVAKGKSGMYEIGAGAAGARADNTQRQWTGYGQAASQGINSGMNYYNANEDRNAYKKANGITDDEE